MMKKLALLAIAVMPLNRFRIFLYRVLCGYRISWNSRVGWLNFIHLDRCEITDAAIGTGNLIRGRLLSMKPGSRIGRFNRIQNVNDIRLGKRSLISIRNRISGTAPGLTPFKQHENLDLGADSIIVSGHLFDLSDTITIGDNVTIGGDGTQFWTHGFDLNHIKTQAPIRIGHNVYLGSRCLIMAGVSIVDSVAVGSGTVVAASIDEPGFYISARLMRKSDTPDFSERDSIVEHGGARFMRKHPAPATGDDGRSGEVS